MQKVSPVAV